uniref:Pentatricopeptide repeat-containing protein n=1 Tax=Davidia involucrata TaxID=16924 RepID=A0A5B7BWQ0_DAVIN
MSFSATTQTCLSTATTLSTSLSKTPNSNENRQILIGILPQFATTKTKKMLMVITMRDRSKNRKPLQRGRNLSIEAIQTVQALKRASKKNDDHSLEQVFGSNFRRLLKFDTMAVLRELLRQNECLLALKVFEDIRKEYWYQPQVSLYADVISVLASNGLFEKVELLFMQMKMESSLEPDIEGFNALLESLIYNFTGIAMECFYLMKTIGCEPDKSSFRILINGLESKGQFGFSTIVRQEARKYYGESLEFLEEKEEMTVS